VDLAERVQPGAQGAKGFMPSLGGAHNPIPLQRRRGKSFLTRTISGNGADGDEEEDLNDSTPTKPTSTASKAGPSPRTDKEGDLPLSSLLTASSQALQSPTATLCFHARNVPAISVEAYLLRILKYCPTTNEVFLSLLVYFDRMARVSLEARRVGLVRELAMDSEGTMSRGFAIDSFNVHRLVIAGVTVASKFWSDVFYTNSRYAKVRFFYSFFFSPFPG
jgi:hypothetical protein